MANLFSPTRIALALACAATLGTYPVRAGETKVTENGTATEEEAPEYKNWIELGIGGVSVRGDEAQFKQEHRMSGDIFGGIQDLHLEQAVGKKGQLTVDGHAIFDNHDYDVRLDLTYPGVGYIRGGYTEFRSWYDGNGGFFPVNGQFFSPPHPEMALDRGEAWVELGLRMPKLPEITLHYSHLFRDGRKDSTIWGDTTLTGVAVNPTRKIAPAFRDINETRDIFSVDILQNFGKTDIGLGMRYEHSEVDDRLQLERNAGQLPPVVAAPGAQRFITDNGRNQLDAFNGHVTTETRFSDSLWFTSAYSYSTLDSDISGTRIIGAGYDSMIGDPILTLQSNDHGVLNLSGVAQVQEHVINFNLLWMPAKKLTLLTAFRYTREDKDSASSFLDSNTAANTAPFTATNPAGGFHRITPVLRSGDTGEAFNNFAETLELRYTGVDHWVFYARGDWEEENGNVKEHVVAAGPVDQGSMNKDTDLLMQKYTVGLNWYPMANLNVSGQYYHKSSDYDNHFISELATAPVVGSERNQRLLHQELDSDDVNFRVTWRPKLPPKLGTIAFVTRYDYVHGTIDGQWGISPANPPGVGLTGITYIEQRTAEITNHVITESVTWNPCARLYLQGNASYVLNKTDTPADFNLIPNTSPTVLDFKNDYWTASGSAGFALDDKTDLRAEYSYYRADNYQDNSLVALPYGMGATEHTVSASVSRQIAKNVRLKVQYGYFHYTDETSGGHNNYEAHAVFSSLQFRF
ncbi:MAG: hypothetical protein QOK24_1866 [Verrucomicrobiota bacterium]|jgi:hypothetical protein